VLVLKVTLGERIEVAREHKEDRRGDGDSARQHGDEVSVVDGKRRGREGDFGDGHEAVGVGDR
jgi:hypothetical protein